MLKWFLLSAFIASSHAPVLCAAENRAAHPLEKLEAELSNLCVEMFAAYDAYYEAADQIKDELEKKKYEDEHEPSAKYVQKLIEFERVHHLSHAGLMAVRRLVFLGGGGGHVGNSRDFGRKQALIALRDYGNADELYEILRYLGSGNCERESETIMRAMINAPDVNDQNKVLAKLAFANWSFKMGGARVYCEGRQSELAQGGDSRFPGEKEHLSESLKALPSAEAILQLEREATAFLEAITKSNSKQRMPGVTNCDEHWHVIRVDQKKTETMPLVTDIAIGMLFNQQHLQMGKSAPDLKVSLVSGQEWSLVEQRGKAVIIQFSFKGCGPCEEMYQDLGMLLDQYPGKLVVLSIMADKDRTDTTDEIASGKLKWDIHWDGWRGPIVTKWAVTSFPTIYIVGPDGQIAGIGLRDKELAAKIAELVR